MASIASKRKRLSFSPPRPKVSKSAANKGIKSTKARGRPSTSNKQKKSCLTSPRAPAPDSAAEEASSSLSRSHSPSAEPDFILAEVTQDNDEASEEPVLPLSLLHRLLHHNFRDKDNTRITTDAKQPLGNYV